MKIGFFTDSYLPSVDGVATSVESAARELLKLGHEVYIVAPSQPHGKERKDIYRMVSIRLIRNPEVWLGLEVPQPTLFKVAKLDVDIVHGHSGGPISFLGWQVAKAHNVPFIETYHTMWRYYLHYHPLTRMLKLWMVKKFTAFIGNDCDAVIAPSLKARKDLLRDGVKKPIYIVPSGIDVKAFRSQSAGFLYKKFDIAPGKKIILTVGRLEKEKSIDFLVRAFAVLNDSRHDCVFVIAGSGGDREKLLRLVYHFNLRDRVYFAGHIPYGDMPRVYKDAGLFVFSSKSETQGMVIVEALASGVPVVAVEDEAFAGVVQNGVNGYMVKRDIDAFAAKMNVVLGDRELRERLQKGAAETGKEFSAEKSAKMLEGVYREVIERK